MAAPQTASGKSRSKPDPGVTKSGKASARPDDAVSLLMADHREAEDLFKQYEKSKGNNARKQAIANTVIAALRVHMVLEEDIFYPASRPFVDEQDTVNEAEVEHGSARALMDQIEAMSPDDDYYDAKVKVLSELIEHHVEEEETEYFPEVRRSEMDLKSVGEEMKARKAELAPKPN